MGRAYASSMGAAPAITGYDRKRKELVVSYTRDVEEKVQSNSGIITWDNYCHVYSSGNLDVKRDSSYVKANYTVVALSSYVFRERPSFLWLLVDDGTAVASLPQLVTDLLAFQDQVRILL